MPKSEKRQRTALVAVRFFPAEKRALEVQAAASGVSVGALIRSRALAVGAPEEAEK